MSSSSPAFQRLVGEKKNDYYKNAYEEVAVSAMKVPLMEVLATGAVPVVVVDNLCMEMEGAGKRIISIMRRQLEEAGLSNVQLTGSTEDNMPTTQSGFGVTAIGLLQMQDCRIASHAPRRPCRLRGRAAQRRQK